MKSLSNFLFSRLFTSKRKYIAAALETLCDIETRKNGVTSVPPMSDEATAFTSESFMNLKKLIFPERSARIIAAFASPILKNGKVRIVDSACPNKDCIRQGVGGTLVCLPNDVIITIENADSETDGAKGKFDAVSF